MIDHISIGVSDLDRSMHFYESVLGAIGYAKLEVRPHTIGFGKRYAEFWLNHRPGMARVGAESGFHVCLRAASTQAVDAFHSAALAAGGRSDGAPSERPQHGVGYYAAFVVDPDGNRVEAVTFLSASAGVSKSGS
jgi:catechol 2,3-dioxygenase-like lactoylglutathione lyase family enzyme